VYSRTDGEGVGVGDGVGVGVTTGVGVGVGVGVTTGIGVTLGVGEVEGTAFITTPLLQTRLLPRLTQVNSRFFETTTVPTFLQDAPARRVFAEALFKELAIRNTERTTTRDRRIRKF
jgi:hypothetical protein